MNKEERLARIDELNKKVGSERVAVLFHLLQSLHLLKQIAKNKKHEQAVRYSAEGMLEAFSLSGIDQKHWREVLLVYAEVVFLDQVSAEERPLVMKSADRLADDLLRACQGNHSEQTE